MGWGGGGGGGGGALILACVAIQGKGSVAGHTANIAQVLEICEC